MRETVLPSPIPRSVTYEKYGDQWVAILRRRVVDHDQELQSLVARLTKRGISEKAILYHVPRPGVILV